ncbi:MAG: cyclase family protein [Holosporales bacterium]
MPFPFTLVDLTHTLAPDIPSWSGTCGFRHEVKLDYADCKEDTPFSVKFRVQQIKMHAGIGTHMDAPAHCIPGGKMIAEIPLSVLMAPCVVVDVSSECNAGQVVSAKDVLAFEQQHGPIPYGAFVIIRTGWERFWTVPEKYRNNLTFPSISGTAAQLLLEREIVGLGIDTLSPDLPKSGESGGYPVHALLLGAGKYIVENVANAGILPPTGAYTLALPIKTADGTEAPVRLVGFLPKKP